MFTAINELVLGNPHGAADKDRPMSEFVFGPDEMQINIPPAGGDIFFFIRLLPGMSVSLAKSVQSFIVADDSTPRRIRVTSPPAEA